MTMIAGLVLLVACETEPVPEAPEQVPPVTVPPDPPPEQAEPTTLIDAAALPIGDGPTEFRVGTNLVGLGFRLNSVEYIYMFQAAVAQGSGSDWDPNTTSIAQWPGGCSPAQLTLTPASCLTAAPLVVYDAHQQQTVCDTQNAGTNGCPRLDAAYFLSDIQSNIGHRIQWNSFSFPTMKTAITTVANVVKWANRPTNACQVPSGVQDTTRNDAYHIGQDRVWQHMLVSGQNRIAKVVHFDQNFQPGTSGALQHVLDWPSGNGQSPGLAAWCNQVNTWCTTGSPAPACYYAELTFTYP